MKIKTVVTTWFRNLASFLFEFNRNWSAIILYLIGLFYTVYFLANLKTDTTSISNAAFAIVASMAALCFSGARSIAEPAEDKDKLTFAGERFFHSSILMISASIIKYAALAVTDSSFGQSYTRTASTFAYIAGTLVLFNFFAAYNTAYTGLVMANRVLWKRFHRYPDEERFFW